MCAINGITRGDRALVEAMNARTLHRGPEGSKAVEVSGVTLGQNRLAIIDLSPLGAQPMEDASGRYVIVYNGELYNYRELKAELQSYPFKSQSDTEVLLAAWSAWGEKALERLNGIFAFALYDMKEETLYLARDRSGVKPLYTYIDINGLRFSSEIAGILADASVPRTLSREAFGDYMRFLYTPGPRTPFEGIAKFPAGHIGIWKEGRLITRPYSTAPGPALPEGRDARLRAVRETIGSAVRRQLVSDRPVGVFLSGGLDSSIILAEASKTHPNIRTFSSSFALEAGEEADKFNADAALARLSSERFASSHRELVIEERDLPQLLSDAALYLGEPVSNPTAAAQLALARFAKPDATVVLTGDGGDELFGGYPRYRLSRAMDLYQSLAPKILRDGLAFGALRKLNEAPGLPRVLRFMALKDAELSTVLSGVPPVDEARIMETLMRVSHNAPTQALMDYDRSTWLVDEALLRTDRLTMAASVEARTPLLDDEVVALAEGLSLNEKVTALSGKNVLRDAYRGILPREVVEAPKRGWFSPGAKWLRRPHFLAFAREVLSPSYHEATSSLFDWKRIEGTLERHVRGEYHLNPLWAALTFQLWAKHYDVRA